MLVAHDAVITNSRKAQHKLGKLVNQGRHPAHKAPVDQLPETVRPPGSEDPLGGSETRGLRQGSIQEAKGATACLRVRPTDSFRFIHASQFVGIGRRFMGIEEHAAARCPCCDAVDVDTRHARICPGAVAHVNQHHPLLHAISRTLKRLGVSHQVESGEHFTADRNLRMDIVVRRGGLRGSEPRVQREAHPAGRDPCRPPSAGTPARKQCWPRWINCLYPRGIQAPTLRSSGTRVLRRTEPQAGHYSGGKLWTPRGRG